MDTRTTVEIIAETTERVAQLQEHIGYQFPARIAVHNGDVTIPYFAFGIVVDLVRGLYPQMPKAEKALDDFERLLAGGSVLDD